MLSGIVSWLLLPKGINPRIQVQLSQNPNPLVLLLQKISPGSSTNHVLLEFFALIMVDSLLMIDTPDAVPVGV